MNQLSTINPLSILDDGAIEHLTYRQKERIEKLISINISNRSAYLYTIINKEVI